MHATEGSIPSRLQEQVQPVTVPEEASTSSHRVSHHSVSFPVPPDPVVAGAPAPASSFKLMRILVFGIVLAAVLVLTATLWALQHGQHRATRSSMKGLIARSYDELDCHVSAACPGGGMQHGTSEYGSLPLCPERQLPSWTQTCASYPVQRTGIVNLSQSCTTPQGIWLMSNPDTQVSRASPSAHSFVVHTGLGLWWGTYPLSPISNHECFRCDISACESPDNTVCERVSRKVLEKAHGDCAAHTKLLEGSRRRAVS